MVFNKSWNVSSTFGSNSNTAFRFKVQINGLLHNEVIFMACLFLHTYDRVTSSEEGPPD